MPSNLIKSPAFDHDSVDLLLRPPGVLLSQQGVHHLDCALDVFLAKGLLDLPQFVFMSIVHLFGLREAFEHEFKSLLQGNGIALRRTRLVRHLLCSPLRPTLLLFYILYSRLENLDVLGLLLEKLARMLQDNAWVDILSHDQGEHSLGMILEGL